MFATKVYAEFPALPQPDLAAPSLPAGGHERPDSIHVKDASSRRLSVGFAERRTGGWVMRKSMTAMMMAAAIAALSAVQPRPAEARCWGCWVGAGFAAGVIGGAVVAGLPNAYWSAWGGPYYGYPPYGYGYGPYTYVPASDYAPPAYYAPPVYAQRHSHYAHHYDHRHHDYR